LKKESPQSHSTIFIEDRRGSDAKCLLIYVHYSDRQLVSVTEVALTSNNAKSLIVIAFPEIEGLALGIYTLTAYSYIGFIFC
jgi:hypothetical protein